MTKKGLQTVAKLYTKHKKPLIELMNRYDADIVKDTPHSQVILDLKWLIDNNNKFQEDLYLLMVNKGIIVDERWNNAFDPVTAIAGAAGQLFGMVGTIAGSGARKKELQLQQDIQSDKFFHDYLLNEQAKSSGKTILIVSGVTFVGLGLFLFLMLKRKK